MNQAPAHAQLQVLNALLRVARKRLAFLEGALERAETTAQAIELRQAIRETRMAINQGERLAA
jgi:hypothetical protein